MKTAGIGVEMASWRPRFDEGRQDGADGGQHSPESAGDRGDQTWPRFGVSNPFGDEMPIPAAAGCRFTATALTNTWMAPSLQRAPQDGEGANHCAKEKKASTPVRMMTYSQEPGTLWMTPHPRLGVGFEYPPRKRRVHQRMAGPPKDSEPTREAYSNPGAAYPNTSR